MNTVAIDSYALNSLFDNQKKLDAMFDSIFDDNNFFINSSSSSSEAGGSYSTFEVERQVSYDSCDVKKSIFAIKQSRFVYALPIVLEIGVFYLLVTNLL
jgi:hypothetical protein